MARGRRATRIVHEEAIRWVHDEHYDVELFDLDEPSLSAVVTCEYGEGSAVSTAGQALTAPGHMEMCWDDCIHGFELFVNLAGVGKGRVKRHLTLDAATRLAFRLARDWDVEAGICKIGGGRVALPEQLGGYEEFRNLVCRRLEEGRAKYHRKATRTARCAECVERKNANAGAWVEHWCKDAPAPASDEALNFGCG